MKLKFISIVILLLLTVSLNISAQKRKKIPPEKPKLVIGLIIEQMRYDYIYKFWNKFGNDGFKRLLMEGTSCKNANYNYLFTQTGVGHATIATGTSPANHGIISQNWYMRLDDKMVYCTDDEKVYSIGCEGSVGKMSAQKLLVTTLGDELKLSNNQKSKVIGISMRESSAILSAGHIADAVYWFDDLSGKWLSSSYYIDHLPIWVNDFNDKKFPDLFLSRAWNTMLPLEEYTESFPDENQYEIGFGRQMRVFPYDLKSFKKRTQDYSMLRKSPYGNKLTKDFAIATIANEKLGQDDFTDLLMVSFSAGEYIGNMFGPTSIEISDLYIRLDKDIAHFLKYIDENLDKKDVMIFLTSDHGTTYSPDYLKDKKIPAGYFNPKSSSALLQSYLKAIYGQGQWVKAYTEQQIYLDHNLIEDSDISLSEIQDKAAQFLIQFNGVANAVTGTTLQTNNFSGNIFEKMQNSYNQKISGDIIINLSPGWVQKEGRRAEKRIASHNSAYTYDTHVPLIWYGWKINRSTIYRNVDMTDIAPTIATFLNISPPNASTGKFIHELID